MSQCIRRAEIQRYIDGELEPEKERLLLPHLEHCTACRAFFKQEQAFSNRIRAARSLVTAPPSLHSAIERQIQQAQNTAREDVPVAQKTTHTRVAFFLAAAAAVFLVLGSMLILRGIKQRSSERMIEAAITAHNRLEAHALPLGITSDSSSAVTDWLQSKVAFPFRMANAGIAADATAKYHLDGASLLTIGKDKAALVAFHLPSEVVSLLVVPGRLLTASGGKQVESGGIVFHAKDQGPVHVVTWNNRGLGYVLAANTSMSRLRSCTTCHQQPAAQASATPAQDRLSVSSADWERNSH